MSDDPQAADAETAPPTALPLPELDEDRPAAPGTFGELEPTAPALVDREGRVRLSFTRVDSYQNCPRRFRYAYVDRLPTRPSPHLSFGSSIHGALERFYDRKLPQCPSEEELLAHLYEAWDTTGFEQLPRQEQLSYYRHAQEVLRRYYRRVAATYRLPAATEAWFELPIGYDAVVVGAIDRIDVDDDGRFHVIDYKTNRRVRDRARAASSLQLALYALACRHLFGALPATVALDFVVAGVEVTVSRDELDLEGARQAVLDTAEAVRAGRFEPTPNALCDWCDFKPLCPAWSGADGAADELLGPAVDRLRALRRQVVHDVRELRELEAAVARISGELGSQEMGCVPDAPAAGTEHSDDRGAGQP